MAGKAPFTKTKARMILSEARPTLRGQAITPGQRGLLGLIAGGGTPTKLNRRNSMARGSHKIAVPAISVDDRDTNGSIRTTKQIRQIKEHRVAGINSDGTRTHVVWQGSSALVNR